MKFSSLHMAGMRNNITSFTLLQSVTERIRGREGRGEAEKERGNKKRRRKRI